MRVFVAGAGGYIGLALCAELIRRGHIAVALDRWFFDKEPPSACVKIDGDIRDVALLDGFDAVIDLAGLSNDAAGDIDPELTREINIEGAKHLALTAKRGGVAHYIYSSSAAVYGSNRKPNLTEADQCNPLTLYAESKVRVEDYLRKIADDSFHPIILRNATVFGVSKRMRFDLVVNGMVRSAWLDRKITVDGVGTQYRPFVHISDVVKTFADALDWQGPVTKNIVSCNHSINDVAIAVARAFPGLTTVHRSSVEKRSYHIKPTIEGVTVAEGIEEVRAALDNGEIDPHDPTAWTVSWYKNHCDLRLREPA